MKDKEDVVLLHLKIHTQQLQAIKQLAKLEGRSQASCMRFLLEAMLEILSKQPRFPMEPEVAPTRPWVKPKLEAEIHAELGKPLYEKLAKKAEDYGVTVPVLVRLLWQTGIAARNRCMPGSKGLTSKEVFIRAVLGVCPLRPPLKPK